MTRSLSRPIAGRIAALPAAPPPAAGVSIPQAVIEAAAQALDDGKTHYTNRPGIVPLREWVSAHLKQQANIEVAPDAITITCGATEARFACVMKLAAGQILCPGDETAIRGAAHLAGAEIVKTAEEFSAASLVYLSAAADRAQVEQVLSESQVQAAWIIWDTSAGETDFHPAQEMVPAARVVTIGSLSAQLPGWRIGWMAGSEMAGQLRAFKQSMTICSPSISQWAAFGLVDTL